MTLTRQVTRMMTKPFCAGRLRKGMNSAGMTILSVLDRMNFAIFLDPKFKS